MSESTADQPTDGDREQTPDPSASGTPVPENTLARMSAPRRVWEVIWRTATRAWDDSIFAKSASAAFWQTLSLPPLLLALLGSIGYVGGWFGPNTDDIIHEKIISFSRRTFSPNVVDQIIEPTVVDVLMKGRGGIVSVGFILTLWAGSSAMATFVDSIVEAHGQKDSRNPVWQRIFALLLYIQFLVASVLIMPLVALGPTLIAQALPPEWVDVGTRMLDLFYYPGVGLLLIVGLTTLYKLALHKTLPWHRLLGGALLAGAFFMGASAALRRYLNWAAESGVSYGALATPIAFLLFTFFLGFAIILGAEFNATIQEFWPARATRIEQMKEWLANQAGENGIDIGEVTNRAKQLATGPIRIATDRVRGPARNDSGDSSADSPDQITEPLVKPANHSPLRNPS
ncbi:YihY/virulence factor BrkB family protein [Antrihabitans sp. YC2-6]|nr:YihY/virulence factor BrkB family protein [Antrihabitans sp. YC2-6]